MDFRLCSFFVERGHKCDLQNTYFNAMPHSGHLVMFPINVPWPPVFSQKHTGA